MMARPTGTPLAIGVALLCLASTATAANPLGMAVAGAPSMFVLAVAQARADDRNARAATEEPEPRAEPAERPRQAAEPAPRRPASERASEPANPDDRKLTLR
ncbi:hypothetical protein [Pseudoduganella lutea]|uniref:Uncharacterized protein n=1 Tax=Pseudoduganella lutea TaxID=321985 RepID=A0A4P6KTX8_9BURK|nr:hypothetical protein [Pseudoduganella lutea]QBE62247.1 hypothetical protein EWM63_03980 [Pseudoduganella lutea]